MEVKKALTRKGFKSIQTQILLPFLVLIIITGVVISVVSYSSSVKMTTNELVKSVTGQMDGMNDTFTLFFTNIENTVERFSNKDLLIHYQSKNEKILETSFNEMITADGLLDIYAGIEKTGEMVDPKL